MPSYAKTCRLMALDPIHTSFPCKLVRDVLREVGKEFDEIDDDAIDLQGLFLFLGATGICLIGGPIAIATTPLGLFVDVGRATKRLHDDHKDCKDKAFHLKIIGHSPQTIK